MISWTQVIRGLVAKRQAMDGLPRGLDKAGWLAILNKKRRIQSDMKQIYPNYPYTAIGAEPETFDNYIGGGLDPNWKQP
jgi:hypothetical protein